MEIASLVMSISSLVLTLFALAGSITALILIVGLKNSTHQVQYVPIDSVVAETEKDPKKQAEETIEDLYESL